MIRGSVERLAILCAAAGVTTAEWEAFVEDTRQSGADEMRRLYSRVRNRLRSLEKDVVDQDIPNNGVYELTNSSVIRDISRLVDEADVSTMAAARRLSMELRKQSSSFDPNLHHFNSKEGLRRWLVRVIREHGESVVLSAALAAFKERHGESDWRLSS